MSFYLTITGTFYMYNVRVNNNIEFKALGGWYIALNKR